MEVFRQNKLWPVLALILAVSGVYSALPVSLALGPRWLQIAIMFALFSGIVITHRSGSDGINQMFGHVLPGSITFLMLWTLVLLVRAVPAQKESAATFFHSAVVLWATNILVFGYWYWHLDGASSMKSIKAGKSFQAFLFPQMTLKENSSAWSPMFIDYLFLAFNTNTAFSPTDSPVLSRQAKALTMLQAVISLIIVAVLAARAVNIA